jgi:hypothetical protein
MSGQNDSQQQAAHRSSEGPEIWEPLYWLLFAVGMIFIGAYLWFAFWFWLGILGSIVVSIYFAVMMKRCIKEKNPHGAEVLMVGPILLSLFAFLGLLFWGLTGLSFNTIIMAPFVVGRDTWFGNIVQFIVTVVFSLALLFVLIMGYYYVTLHWHLTHKVQENSLGKFESFIERCFEKLFIYVTAAILGFLWLSGLLVPIVFK